jgi:ParB family transcriptional regulator, chromosome partitioning protein
MVRVLHDSARTTVTVRRAISDSIANYNGDGMIPCIIIPAERSSVFRQAKENTARAGLSAIAMARQVALLLLAIHGYEIPT